MLPVLYQARFVKTMRQKAMRQKTIQQKGSATILQISR